MNMSVYTEYCQYVYNTRTAWIHLHTLLGQCIFHRENKLVTYFLLFCFQPLLKNSNEKTQIKILTGKNKSKVHLSARKSVNLSYRYSKVYSKWLKRNILSEHAQLGSAACVAIREKSIDFKSLQFHNHCTGLNIQLPRDLVLYANNSE